MSRTGYKIYYDITEEQIKNGLLKEKDPKEIAMQQGAALNALEMVMGNWVYRINGD